MTRCAVPVFLLLLVSGGDQASGGLRRTGEIDPGFNAANVLTLDVSLPDGPMTDVAAARRFWVALTRLSVLPGVSEVSATSNLPLTGEAVAPHVIEGPTRNGAQRLGYQYIADRYFRAMRTPLLKGRALDRADAENRTGAVIVSRAAAMRLWPGSDPIGRHLRPQWPAPAASARWYTVVGVVGDVYQHGLDDPGGKETIYYPLLAQTPGEWTVRRLTFVVRTDVPPQSIAFTACREIAAVAPELQITNVRTLAEVVDEARGHTRQPPRPR